MVNSNFYRRNLPHWQPANAEYFVTFRLSGSIPESVINQLRQEQKVNGDIEIKSIKDKKRREIFRKYEEHLDSGYSGPTWLRIPIVAQIVQEALFHRDQDKYDLYAFSIMSNHVHVVFKLLENNESGKFPVTDIFRNLKSFTALKANRSLGRAGSFWQGESYDRVIRSQKELENTIWYVLSNPVKANLVNTWRDWEFTYCKPTFLGSVT